MPRPRKWIYMYTEKLDSRGRLRRCRLKIPVEQWYASPSGTNSADMRNTETAMEGIDNSSVSSTSKLSEQMQDNFIEDLQLKESSTEASNHKKRKIQEANGWQKIRGDLIQVRIEGFSPATKNCSICGCTDVLEIVWCPDCGPTSLYCKRCDEHIHQVVMYHQSYIWKEDTSLFVPLTRETLLVNKHQCEKLYCRQIRVFDVQGRHHVVKAQFCECEPEALTLLRHNLWPATPTRPETAFSLKLMELCRMLQLEGQLSLQKFCTALQRMTTFLPDHTSEFIDMYNAMGNALSEFHHHQMSCMEMAHVPEIMGKKCPICTMKPERSVISMDANFGLVHKVHSGCGPGLEHARFNVFCPDDDVKTFVDSHHQATSKSGSQSVDCSNFQAGDILRSKNKNAQLDIKGVFGAVCHHGFPLHFVNMQHGERFGYPVYILKRIAEEQTGTATAKRIVMYDVACKLETHVKKHAELTGRLAEKFRFSVPVFHSYAHNTKCQVEYGQRFCEGTGLIDGEATERLWSFLRRFAWSKEMTLPNRQDLLSSALLCYAQKIFFSIAETLYLRLKKARERHAKSKDVIKEVESKCKGTAVEWMCHLKQILLTAGGNGGLTATDSLMEKARKLSTERQQLLCLKKRYADGQKIAQHLSKKLKANSTQLQAVANLLKDQGINVSVAQLSDPESAVYALTPQGLNQEQVRAANCVVECFRAQEEEARILEDVSLFQQWLLERNTSLCPQLCAKPATRYEHGMKHVRSLSKLKVEKELRSLSARFSDLPELQNPNIDYSISNLLSASVSINQAPLLHNSHDPSEVTDIISDIDSDTDVDSDADSDAVGDSLA